MKRELRFIKNAKKELGVEAVFDDGIYVSKEPVEIIIKEIDGSKHVYTGGYQDIQLQGGAYLGEAVVKTRFGSIIQVNDSYAWKDEEVIFDRRIKILYGDGHETGFSSAFAIKNKETVSIDDYDVFIPGVWYGKNEHVVQNAFGSSREDREQYIRVTRMALPYVELFDKERGGFLVMRHLLPAPDTGLKEETADWLVDETFQYSSMGIRKKESMEICYHFPGSEGEKNYIDGRVPWARRSHPLRTDVKHEYSFSLMAGKAHDSREAMQKAWRCHFERSAPSIAQADMKKVYEASIQTIDIYCQEYNGAMGIPFWAQVPEGNVCDISFQMGFVGQQTMCAYQLMRFGYRHGKMEQIEKGKKIIDFWVEHSTQSSVIPRVWYNAFPATFKEDYPTYTRTVAEGMEGILVSYLEASQNGCEKKKWKSFCISYGNWLTENQNEDGSWYRSYDETGRPVHLGKYNTGNVIRYLVNLYWLTGNERYKEAALRAGNYCYLNVYLPLQYVGGTADNDNTIDKEAGMLAMYAFLTLYELEGEERFLEAAKGAADFCETWTYSWSFPIKPYKGNCVFDKVSFTGLSLIATGHSHADVMMGYMPFEYYKLWLYTKDRHYLEFCRFIHQNTKQTIDWSGKLGHVYQGLVEESGELAMQYYNGLGKWLPWCSIAEIESLTRLEEKFGSMDMEELTAKADENLIKLRQPKPADGGKSCRSSWLR